MANTRGLRAGRPEESVGERSLSLVSGPVLVTGGAGYIGSHVCKALAEAGTQPICLDTLEKGHDWAVRWGSLEQGDVGDGRFVEKVFVRHRPQVVISLRYFNATGADSAAEIGEAHDPETPLLPLAVDAALGLRGSLVVHGSDYRTEDGSCVRDYVHVTDLADAHLRAVHWLMSQKGRGRHDVFNLGSGTGHSVKQVVDSIGRLVGRPVPHVYGARRPGDSPRLVGCIDKAQRELGWSPLRGLETQIEDTVRWRMSMRR